MGSALLPTTRAQVTGHRFLRRRVEHGLVFGDIRMIHDPLAARRRAMMFGLVATVLVAAGAGLLAWLRPAADPGEAPILQTGGGALFVRVDDRVHPVANLASARLIVGEPLDPARIGDDLLAATPGRADVHPFAGKDEITRTTGQRAENAHNCRKSHQGHAGVPFALSCRPAHCLPAGSGTFLA